MLISNKSQIHKSFYEGNDDSIVSSMRNELERLGIKAKIYNFSKRIDYNKLYLISFKNEEDLNLFKLASKWANYSMLDCVVGCYDI